GCKLCRLARQVRDQDCDRLIDHGARCATISLALNAGPTKAPTPSAGSPGDRGAGGPSTSSYRSGRKTASDVLSNASDIGAWPQRTICAYSQAACTGSGLA